ncbi:lysozyme [Epibacterium ulvae]|uniref:lysozyme n=1 Tax=Epibacterium ulvae TaxID=1156985 RepID=UPI001BFC0ED1|nr:lysozyme [Epibacterium ulvae]MBT8152759.1 lysozyme [Epibacterium ulvae]
MKLQDDWKQTARTAWSIRLMVVAALIAGLAAFLAAIDASVLGVPPLYFAAASALLNTLAIPARLILQDSLPTLRQFFTDEGGAVRKRTVGLLAAGGVALSGAVSFVGQWEGLRTEAYRDIVGVWTVCYGETKGVTPIDRYSKAECDRMLGARVLEFERELDRCLTGSVPVGAKIAFVSWAYNVGVGAACRSTLVRKANVGDVRGACNELPRWNRAGGRVVRGLTNRRMSERDLCLRAVEGVA